MISGRKGRRVEEWDGRRGEEWEGEGKRGKGRWKGREEGTGRRSEEVGQGEEG